MILMRFLLIVYFVCVSFVCAAEEFKHLSPKKINWKFDGILGSFDKQSIQRGYQVYREVCSSCHSMKRIAFRNLRDVGFSEEEVKAIAASYQVLDGPNDIGEMFERPGIKSDYFIPPFPNKEAAMAANKGAFPPDLSLIIKARHNGANYLYSLLTGYESHDPDESGLYTNPYFTTGKMSMAPPLSDGLVQYTDGTDSKVENMAYDVVNFLQWAAEPEMETRKKLGIKVISFLLVLTIFVILANKRLWKDLYKK
ncbi:cytochrome c1 [Ehrlichia chaffeensis str. Heartland]|uniref:Cytochrome c1 n=1 Tax=Ehrlichia chaffeensis (strain ATCC CRL-10679 / Arkansas) TaxID=205920 RepID=Q2GGU6_EHRCR|nr:ubiquinol-cytochrome c reductase, cytochrome c1 [Ehrlichia chaffeensis str. Arkansas]AHX03616.1 cytochrome c1 [Ehrlichia chaffeensis str. Heartland]AHX06653.1 cytochrome c1 [Ehrlichia chaffeensis str. Liberty]AHX09032.1 cytochrome c1 [Ehrlichia chaffeensis str. Saint Vincent]AHX09761.1 cytochrome c1 [Ehrlichia chaffeensis str. Wakulla]AHX10221.1 cytochrome c1 [Ehrlichia chaffeensis str. West Paces]